jgi:hypothetical protein
MTRRRLPALGRVFVLLAGGLLLGALAAVTGFGSHVERPLAGPPLVAGCTVAGGTATVVLGDGSTTVSTNAAKDLVVTIPGGAPVPCGVAPLAAGISAIKFAVAGPPAPTADTLVINETAAAIPCAVAVSGTVGNGATTNTQVAIDGFDGAGITVGATTLDLDGCGTSQGTLAAVGSYSLATNGGSDLSALGDSADPVTVPVTFVAGQGDATGNSETFESADTATALDFSQAYGTCPQAPCSLVVNDSGAALASPVLGDLTAAITDQNGSLATYDFSSGGDSVTAFTGLASGSTDLFGQAGSYNVTGLLVGSQVTAGAGTETFTVPSANGTTFTSGPGSDTFTVTGNNNTFQAGAGTDTFYDTVTSGTPANTVDFSNVLTSPGAQLAINAAGAPETVGSTTLPNGHAAVGTASPAYTFLDSPSSANAANFTTILGASKGSTAFLVGGSGGLTLNGQGTGNSTQFFGNSGVVVNLAGVSETTSAQIGPSTGLSGFTLGLGQVLVAAPGGATSCTAAPTDCDTLTGAAGAIETATGPATGFSTFYAGAGPGTYTFSDPGGSNTFFGGSGRDVFSSAGNSNTFVAGSGSATFSESAPAQGASNTIDFSNVPVGAAAGCSLAPCSLTVNVSGSPTAVSNFQAAVLNAAQSPVATYSFASGGADFTNFLGATGGSASFDGGLGNYTYVGQGPGNTLDFSDVSTGVATALSFDVTHTPSPLATLQNVPETFSGITNLVGLPGGGTTFVGGSTGGYTFQGNGTGNQATFSAEGPSTTLTVTVKSPNPVADPITGGTVTFSLPGGAVLCSSVPVVANGGSGTASCSTSQLPAGTDQVVSTYTPPSGSGLSGSGSVLSASGSGTGAPPRTSVTGVTIPSPLSSGTPVTVSATVNTFSSTPIAPGTLTFSLAGNQTLCSATVSGGSTTPETASCSATFPAGTWDVLAVYDPANSTVSGSVVTTPVRVTATSPQTQSKTAFGSYQVEPTTCGPLSFPLDCVTATVSGPATGFAGTVVFSVAGGPAVCSVPFSSGSSSAAVACSPFSNGFITEAGQQIVAVFSSSASGVSGSGAVSGPVTGLFGSVIQTATTMTVSPVDTSQSPEAVIQGTSVTLAAAVSSSGALPGGQVVFSQAGGSALCSATVPGGSTSANVECSVSLPTVGFLDIVAVYTPSSTAFGGSAMDLPIQVAPPVSTSASATSVPATKAGVVVNLSSTPFATTAVNPIPGVTVNGGQVLVAAPPTGTSTCSQAPLPSFCDSLTDVSVVNGSRGGNSTFIAGSSSESFGDLGTAGGDALDFANVATSSGTPLTVNVSGGPAGPLPDFTAAVGSITYSASSGGPNFTNLTGSSSGNTMFLAGGTGGYSFTATSANNSIDFSAATTGVAVNLSAGSTGSVTGFGNSLTDTIAGLTTVIGSSAGGNSFTAGPAPTTYNFTGNGDGNSFTGGGGSDTFTSSGDNNTFTAGPGSATFVDPGSGNTVDFSALTQPVTVDVSGEPVFLTPNDSATAGSATYSFASFLTTPATFNGSPAGSTFYAGTPANSFEGAPGATNELSFAFTPGGPLAVCVVSGTGCTAGEAVLGSVKEQFSHITEFVGLAGGNTTFVAGNPDGTTFDASGSNNVADFSDATAGVTVNLTAGSTGTVGSDPISGLTTVIGSGAGGSTFEAGGSPTYTFTGNGNGNTFDGGTGADTFSSTGSHNTFNVGTGPETLSDTGTANALSFGAVPTSSSTPLTVNVSGTPVNSVSNDTATVGSVTYSFTVGGNGFTTLTGAATGNTDFHAAGAAGGYSFNGAGPNNTVDLSANLCGITANMVTGTVAVQSGPGCATSNQDAVSGITSVVGSPLGSNTFDGDLLGNTFSAGSSINTLSYLGFSGSGVCVNLTSDRVGQSCSGGGAADAFAFSPGTLAIEGSPGNDTFQVGAASVALEGGGGHDTLDLSQTPAPASGTAGVTVDLNGGSVSGPSIGGVTFTPGCGSAADLCVTTVKGSKFDDSFLAKANSINGAPAVAITGGGGNDSLNLSAINTAATIEMPITGTPLPTTGTCSGALPGPTGFVCAPAAAPGISFSGIPTVIGTAAGGDYVFAGSGTESLTEIGSPGTLDYSAVPTPANTTNAVQGITVDVNNSGGTLSGTVISPVTINITDSFSDIGTFTGTRDNDTFIQAGPGTYEFDGGPGANTLDLSAAAPGTTVSLSTPSPGCTTGIQNNNGTASGNDVSDTFTCMGSVITSASEYQVQPGQTATVNGAGSGTLMLVGDAAGGGVTVTLPVGAGPGTVTGDGYNFSFAGMSTIDGTPYDDLFVPGSASVAINGEGGVDGIASSGAPAAEVVNLSGSSYTVPTGSTDAGTTVPAGEAIGGYGGVITLQGISNVVGTARFNDVMVAGPGSGTLTGGAGNDTFVLTGGNDVINGTTGSNTLDLSLLPGVTTLNLGLSTPQLLGATAGTVAVVPGTVQQVIASPGGSNLQAGPGNITLVGGPGNDWLAAGSGTQRLIGGGGIDTLIAGVGTDELDGGAQPVTFIPGQGTDTLTSQMTSPGNTLSYAGVPSGAMVNLSNQVYSVPAGEPFAGTSLNPDQATGGWGAMVTLIGAEIGNVVGSPGADIFVTGSSGDTVAGNGGADLFVVTGGNNTLTAGAGSASRFLFDAAGSNIINGGGLSTADFSLAPAGVKVNLQQGQATGGFGGLEAISGFVNVIGSNFNDVLVAGARGGQLTGLDGNDLLQSGPAGGNVLVGGGNGNDTFCAAAVCAVSGTVAGGGDSMLGSSGDDTFFARNGVSDSINGGGGDNAAQVDAALDHVTNIQQLLP